MAILQHLWERCSTRLRSIYRDCYCWYCMWSYSFVFPQDCSLNFCSFIAQALWADAFDAFFHYLQSNNRPGLLRPILIFFVSEDVLHLKFLEKNGSDKRIDARLSFSNCKKKTSQEEIKKTKECTEITEASLLFLQLILLQGRLTSIDIDCGSVLVWHGTKTSTPPRHP